MPKTDDDFALIIQAAETAANTYSPSVSNVEDHLFPLWEKAIHQMIVRRDKCPCINASDHPGCYLHLSREVKIARLERGKFGFHTFASCFQEALQLKGRPSLTR